MSIKITQEQDLLFQSYFTVTLLAELTNNKFIESSYFNEMPFGATWIKNELRKIGVDNQGCALMALYAMLVIPKEIIQQTYSSDYEKIDDFLKTRTQNTVTTYSTDASSIKYLRHIRNAVAHARVEFRPNDAVIFKDVNSRSKETFSAELPLKFLGELIHQLQMVHIAYIRDLQKESDRSD
jgi:hypothetical protein